MQVNKQESAILPKHADGSTTAGTEATQSKDVRLVLTLINAKIFRMLQSLTRDAGMY